mmetsp:Transcript_16938/g.27717  ORF Transcript_16938/g.27717 Transcript_16938/m.27717 type:complete len:448 (+) Transcript_16938:193-1536(+)
MQTNQRQRQQPHHRGATRLKCIILGSANAGKTCLLRRYVHDKFEDDIDVNNKSSSKRISRSTNSTLGADYYVKKTGDDGSVYLQLWDTAGKERLKPQKIPNEYDKKSSYPQFLSISIKDSNAKSTNHYYHRYNNWGNGTIRDAKEQTQTQLQGHEGDKHHQDNQTEVSKPLGDSLFRNVHVCMLVYDATSSTSFLHAMQWHSEWIQKWKHWEKEDMSKEQSKNDGSTPLQMKRRRRRVPFIVVASKIDLVHEENVTPIPRQGEYRSVMGFSNGEYKGKGYAYEYAAEDYSTDESESDHQPEDRAQLTYSLKETSWSNDETYLKSLQQAEDQLPANRLMILLWCKRNRIPHVEASALTGEGVTEAMDMLVQLGVKELEAREQEQIEQEKQRQIEREKQKGLDKEKTFFVYQPRYDKDLDLFARYSSDNEKKCSVFSCFRSFFSSCLAR